MGDTLDNMISISKGFINGILLAGSVILLLKGFGFISENPVMMSYEYSKEHLKIVDSGITEIGKPVIYYQDVITDDIWYGYGTDDLFRLRNSDGSIVTYNEYCMNHNRVE